MLRREIPDAGFRGRICRHVRTRVAWVRGMGTWHGYVPHVKHTVGARRKSDVMRAIDFWDLESRGEGGTRRAGVSGDEMMGCWGLETTRAQWRRRE